jgi:hypothetical protein
LSDELCGNVYGDGHSRGQSIFGDELHDEDGQQHEQLDEGGYACEAI